MKLSSPGFCPSRRSGGLATILHCGAAVLLAVVVACISLSPAHAVTIDWVTVGDPGNAADTTGYGAVGYEYQIGKYEVTIQQYTDFLNAAAKSDPYSLYDTSMASNLNIAGISRSGTSGGYSYSVIGPFGITPAGARSSGNRPITCVSWFDAARFANWMHNGQGTGSTETGAYTISTGQITAASRTDGVNTYTLAAPSTLSVGDQVAVTGLVGTAFNVRGIVTSVAGSQFTMANTNSDAVATGSGSMTGASATASSNAQFYIPTENEWYKAAYYSPVLNSGSGGYWVYATQSNAAPGNTIGSGANQANYMSVVSGTALNAVTQSVNFTLSQNYLTDVGAFTNSASYYGTFDQSGNVREWNAVIAGTTSGSPGSSRGSRGGDWINNAFTLSSAGRVAFAPSIGAIDIGFRLASPVPVPEPSTWVMGLAGIACAGWGTYRRRKKVTATKFGQAVTRLADQASGGARSLCE